MEQRKEGDDIDYERRGMLISMASIGGAFIVDKAMPNFPGNALKKDPDQLVSFNTLMHAIPYVIAFVLGGKARKKMIIEPLQKKDAEREARTNEQEQVLKKITAISSTLAAVVEQLNAGRNKLFLRADGTYQVSVDTQAVNGKLIETLDQFIERLALVIEQIQMINGECSALSQKKEGVLDGIGRVDDEIGNIVKTTEEIVALSGLVRLAAGNINQTAISTSESLLEMNRSLQGITGNCVSVGTKTGQANEDFKSTAENIEKFRMIARKVSTLLKSIEAISSTAKMVSLNGAIEAENAGEAGKGFQIVVNEMRALTERIVIVTTEIGELVESIHEHTNRTVESIHAMAKTVEMVQASNSKTVAGLEEQSAKLHHLEEGMGAISRESALVATNAGLIEPPSQAIHRQALGISEEVKGVYENARLATKGARDLAGASAGTADQLSHAAQQLIGEIGEGTKQIEGMSEKVGDNTAALKSAIKGLGHGIVTATEAAEDFEELLRGDEFMKKLKSDHLEWVGQLEGFISKGQSPIKAQASALDEWIKQAKGTLSTDRDFSELEKAHQKASRLARDIITRVQEGDKGAANKSITQLKELQLDKVFVLFDRLFCKQMGEPSLIKSR